MILYLDFIGARTHQERLTRKLNHALPLIVAHRGLVCDCDESAFQAGVRVDDTLRQAKIAAPLSQILHVENPGGEALEEILQALSAVSPFVEPTADRNGVFVDLGDTPVTKAISPLEGLFFKVASGSSRSKLVARALGHSNFQKLLGSKKISGGKTPWGFVNVGENFVHAEVKPGKERTFLLSSPLNSLWMAPPDVLYTLRSLGLKKVRDVAGVPVNELARHVGDWAWPLKKWAGGEDFSRVKASYPPLSVGKKGDFEEPVLFTPGLLDPVLEELSDELAGKGLGFKRMELTLTGDFPPLTVQRKLSRPVCSVKIMKLVLESLLDRLSSSTRGRVSGYDIRLLGTELLQAKPVSLFPLERSEQALPVSLDMTLAGIKDRFGDEAIKWGKKDSGASLRSEVLRREEMLKFWDPMRKPAALGR